MNYARKAMKDCAKRISKDLNFKVSTYRDGKKTQYYLSRKLEHADHFTIQICIEIYDKDVHNRTYCKNGKFTYSVNSLFSESTNERIKNNLKTKSPMFHFHCRVDGEWLLDAETFGWEQLYCHTFDWFHFVSFGNWSLKDEGLFSELTEWVDKTISQYDKE